MKCPKCKKELEYVNVLSRCWQKGYLKETKDDFIGEIDDYVFMEITETTDLECPECFEYITKFIRE